MFAAGHQPRAFFTAAAKSAALQDLRARIRRGASGQPLPLVNRFGRPYLPIDRDVPPPARDGKMTARPFAIMGMGDSFFEPCGALTAAQLAQRIKWDAKAHRPRRFDLAEVTENGTPGLRVWRVA